VSHLPKKRTKVLEFIVEVQPSGKLGSPAAEIVRSSLAGHFGGRYVKFKVEGIVNDISLTKKAFYRTQFLPCFLDAIRQATGEEFDPLDVDDQNDLNLSLGAKLLGYEQEFQNIAGEKIRLPKNPELLSDREFGVFLRKAIAAFKTAFGVDVIRWEIESNRWNAKEEVKGNQ